MGTGELFFAQCFPAEKSSSTLPFRLPYTGYANIDIILCLMVSFFAPAAQEAPQWRYTLDLVGSLAVHLTPFLLDVSSLFSNTPFTRLAAIGVPLGLGFIYTFKSGAVVLPAYWAFSLIVRSVQRSVSGVTVPVLPNTLASQATAFAILAGYILPSMLMTFSRTPRHIALWVGFACTVALAQTAFYVSAALGSTVGLKPLDLVPIVKDMSSYDTIQATYIVLFIFSTLTHLPLLFGILLPSSAYPSSSPIPTRLEAFRSQLIPHLTLFTYPTKAAFRAHALRDEVRRNIIWDNALIALGTWLAGVWGWLDVHDTALVARVVCVSLVGSFLVGPGAVVAAVFMVREVLAQHARVGGPIDGLSFIGPAVDAAYGMLTGRPSPLSSSALRV